MMLPAKMVDFVPDPPLWISGARIDYCDSRLCHAMFLRSIVVDPNPSSDFVKELQEIGDERVWIVSGWNIGTFGNFVKHLLPDLREEEIDAKVMKTFNALAFKESPAEVDDGE